MMKKVSLYKFTHIPLLKNNDRLKTKKCQTTKKKKQSPKFIKKNKKNKKTKTKTKESKRKKKVEGTG